MIKDAIATGNTIEEAQQAAVLALAAPENVEVQFEVISFPEKKKFGLFGGKPAEVKAYYEAKDEKPAVKSKSTKNNEAKKPTSSEKKETAQVKEKKTKKEENTPKEVIAITECPDTIKKAYDYLNTIVDGIGVKGSNIEVLKGDKEYLFNITCDEDYSLIIGRRGETLDSIQYLVRLVANRGKEENNYSRISINVGNYRQKRETTLKEIAKKTAGKVKKYGRSVALEPMNPFERRIIHTVISEMDDVVSYSVGSDADRKVIIALADGVKPMYDKKPYNNSSHGGYNNRGRNYNRNKQTTNDNKVESPSRAPRSDAEGLSRYGKIQPKD